jgi:hypothetical protein
MLGSTFRSLPAFQLDKDIYVQGMFNNYSMTPNSKWTTIQKKGIYEKAILIRASLL